MWRIAWISILAFVGSVSSSATGETIGNGNTKVLSCSDAGRAIAIELPDNGPAFLELETARSGVLEIVETGQQVLVRASTPVFEITVPLRHARRFVEFAAGASTITVERQQSNRASGHFVLLLDCALTQTAEIGLNWLRRAADLSRELTRPAVVGGLDTFRHTVDRLDADSQSSAQHALSRHLWAQALVVNGENNAAVEAFVEAERAWSAAGDTARATMAHLGWIEDLVRTGQFAKVAGLLSAVPDSKGSASPNYVQARIQNARCVALDNLGRLSEANACYEWTTKALRDLNETTELVNAMRNQAMLLHEIGASEQAATEARAALGLASGPDAAMVRGRVHLTLADIDISMGKVVDALVESNSASAEFAHANSSRWQANSLLGIAQLYRELGAHDEAYASLAEALRYLSARDAPTRLADAMSLFSDLESDALDLQSANLWLRAAEDIYARHNMPEQLERSRIRHIEQLIQEGKLDGASQQLSQAGASGDVEIDLQRKLAEIELALRQGRLNSAGSQLVRMRAKVHSLRDQIRTASLEGEYWNLTGDPSRGQQVMLDFAARVSSLEQSTREPILRYIIGRQTYRLRQTAVRMALQRRQVVGDRLTIDRLWTWLAPTERYAGAATGIASNHAERFDRAVAAALLPSANNERRSAETDAQRELLSLLAQPGIGPSGQVTILERPPLTSLQRALDPDSVLVAYVDGGNVGAVLRVSRDRVDLIDTVSPSEIRANVANLLELLRSANSSTSEIQAAALRLSGQLLGDVPAPPPTRLYALADSSLNGVPWSVLSWPGTTSYLIETTLMDVVRLTSSRHREAALPATLQAIVAAESTGDAPLPTLISAEAEPAAIRAAISDMPVLVLEPAANRSEVLASLRVQSAWIHIAAHGMSQPQRLGFGGIWLDPPRGENTPQFLSWLDVLDSGVGAELVVLNACQLGDSGTAVDGNLSFADAVSRAGARHVVASLWPVSDAASALWVPAFYSAISADPHHDASHALRAAQLRLRDSRAFRHPFFWAGMQVIDQMAIGTGMGTGTGADTGTAN